MSCDDVNTVFSYEVDKSGSFNPISGSGTVVGLNDDEVSPPLPIGFDFRFYDNTYSDFHIVSNGLLGFNLAYPGIDLPATGCCLGQVIPDPAVLNNIIAFAWEDLSPNLGGTIDYFTTGTAPNRILVMNFEIIAFFNGAGTVRAQVQLLSLIHI